MEKKSVLILLICGMFVFIISCRKEINTPAPLPEGTTSVNNDNSQRGKKSVYISNVEELYAAVNNADNAGTELVLAPGTYVLNAGYPNGGRLELQTDMSLKGQPGQTAAVLIDQSSLPASSFRLTPTVSTGGIRVGKGTNSIEWVTLKGGALAVNPFSVIETDLIGTETYLNISHVNIDCNGSRIGVMLRNRLDEHANRVVNVSLEHSEIFGATNSPGAGIALQNRISGSQINLEIRENYVHANKIRILSFNGALTSSIENCKAQITSYTDRIEGNGCGIDPSSATNGSATTTANNNSFAMKMYGSSILYNNPAGHPELIPTNGALPGGIYVAGGYNSLNSASAFNTISNNTARLEFWGCNISNNNAADFYAYGLWSVSNAVLAGTNNVTEIYLHGISANATVESAASIPAEAAGTNIINVIRN